MTFVFPLLLGSLALVGIPVLIHLIMRQEPIKLPFPAFRFLLQRHRTNLRKLRLRHLVLLGLRMLLIAAICLALARPKLFYQGMSISSDQPVAAVLVFDTSLSMEYKTSDEVSRLQEAAKRGLELIDQLPESSRVAVLDTADVGSAQWLQSRELARDRIKALQLRSTSAPVSQRLESAYRLLAELAGDKEDETARRMPRLVFVFSDRTRASWDAARIPQLRDFLDRVSPTLLGLQQARADLPNLVDLLGELRQQIPPSPGQDYPEQALLDGLGQLREALPRLTPQDLPPDAELGKVLDLVRRRIRETTDILLGLEGKVPDSAKEYREKLLAALITLRRDLEGAQGFFVDVGIDHPADVAVLDLALPPGDDGQPRQLFTEDERIQLKAVVQATGKDVSTMLRLNVAKKTFQKSLDIKAGELQTVAFELNLQEMNLGPGQHSAELTLETRDQLPFNNNRFVTFAVREPRRVLVLADEPKKATLFAKALNAAGFSPNLQLPAEFAKTAGPYPYEAIYLLSVAAPSDRLWAQLEAFLKNGGGVGVIPGGDELRQAAYNQKAGQKVLPGSLEFVVQQNAKPAEWHLKQDSIFRHELLRRFRGWRDDGTIDFNVRPRWAKKYWDVQPQAKEMVLVRYADDKDRPALLENLIEKTKGRPGKVLLFTTPFSDDSAEWNNYADITNSFYSTFVDLATNYLAGGSEAVHLNFIAGKADPVVPLPPAPRYPLYLLKGPNLFEEVPLAEGANELVFKQAVQPGKYEVGHRSKEAASEANGVMARFSVNVPAEESDLRRVPVAEVEAVLGPDSVLPAHRQASIHDILQGHWNEPVELFPPLMVLLLLILAVENLLANKFYRKEKGV